ncbi:MAG TPA: ATP-dependent DNA helicase [Candidatus Dormibacteraeota bacterium]|nr:ATP-dependent DNA helicase [Candidatus Dormibacteraeota bacterium]
MSRELQERLIAQLTAAQQEVVGERGRGPIKVIAAAGSGKTTTMAALYALAVLDGLLPTQILAVTFTERAAEELRQRISATLAEVDSAGAGRGPALLDGAWIGTFHHVARRLIAEQAYAAGVPRDLRTLDDLEARMELERAARTVRDELPRKLHSQALFPLNLHPRGLLAISDGVIDAVSRLRSTELSPAVCRRLSEAAYRRFAAAGDPEEELSWHRLALEVTLAVWEEYEATLSSQRCLDFDGLLRLALSALTQSRGLGAWCHANFQLVIVDEFQDTSAIQSALLDQVVGSRPQKLFVVGDARQSIFAFRDAKPGIMEAAPGRSLRLFRNHRSRWPILAAADHVIRADQQFAADLPMEVARQEAQALPVLLGLAPDPDREAEGIAEFLELCHCEGVPGPDGELRKVGYEEMAVLAYTFSKLGAPLEDALRRRGVPFRTATGGLLRRPEIKDALALLRLIVDPDDDLAWIRVLQSAWIRVSDSQMLRVCAPGGVENRPICERVEASLSGGGWDPDVAVRVSRLLSTARELHEASKVRAAPQLVPEAIAASGLLAYHEAWALVEPEEGGRALAALRSLNRVAISSQANGSWLGLGGFLERLGTMAKLSGRAEPPPPGDRAVVTLSTIHRAKGLEWSVVVLADCRSHHQRGRPAVVWDRGEACLEMPAVAGKNTAAGERWKATADARVALEEHRRLVYVAMTRARDLLLVSTTRSRATVAADSVEELSAQLWAGAAAKGEFAELVKALGAGEEWVGALPGFPDSVQLPWVQGPEVSLPGRSEVAADRALRQADSRRLATKWEQIEALEIGSVARRPLSSARLSFSGLRLLELCPRQYWFQHVAHFQSRSRGGNSEDAAAGEFGGHDGRAARSRELGSLVHAVLERAHRIHPDAVPSTSEVESIAGRLGQGLSDSELQPALELLRGYCTTAVAGLPTVATELPFFWRGWAGIGVPPLVGVVDRVAVLEDGARLVLDYKTNYSLNSEQLVAYSHQLRLYAMALDAAADPSAAPTQAALVVLRTRQLIPVDCSAEARQRSREWGASLAGHLAGGGEFSALGHPNRPCSDCPFEPICPERRTRPQVAAERTQDS